MSILFAGKKIHFLCLEVTLTFKIQKELTPKYWVFLWYYTVKLEMVELRFNFSVEI